MKIIVSNLHISDTKFDECTTKNYINLIIDPLEFCKNCLRFDYKQKNSLIFFSKDVNCCKILSKSYSTNKKGFFTIMISPSDHLMGNFNKNKKKQSFGKKFR